MNHTLGEAGVKWSVTLSVCPPNCQLPLLTASRAFVLLSLYENPILNHRDCCVIAEEAKLYFPCDCHAENCVSGNSEEIIVTAIS